jgi:WD40 repeat protein
MKIQAVLVPLLCLLSCLSLNAQLNTESQIIGRGTLNDLDTYQSSNPQIALVSSTGLWIYSANFETYEHLTSTAYNRVQWRPNGDQVATWSESEQAIDLWNITDSQQTLRIPINDKRITPQTLEWNSTGRYIAVAGADQEPHVWIWDTNDGSLLQTLSSDSAVQALAWHPIDPNQLLIATHDIITLFRLAPAEIVQEFPVTYTQEIAWEGNGQRIAIIRDDGRSSSENALEIWDTETTQLLLVIQAEQPTTLSWQPLTNHIVTGSQLGRIQLWDSETGEIYLDLSAHQQPIHASGWLSPTQMVTAGNDHLARIWDIETFSPQTQPTATLANHTGTIQSLEWINYQSFISAGDDGVVRIWSFEDSSVQVVAEYSSSIVAMALSADNRFLALGIGSTIHIFRLSTSMNFSRYRSIPVDFQVQTLDWSMDNNVLAVSGIDGAVRGFYRLLFTDLETITEPGYSPVWHPNRLEYAILNGYPMARTISVIDAQTRQTRTIPCSNCSTLEWSQNGHWLGAYGVVGESGGAFFVWDNENEVDEPQVMLIGEGTPQWCGSDRILTQRPDSVSLWDFDGESVTLLRTITQPDLQMAICSPQGDYMIVVTIGSNIRVIYI